MKERLISVFTLGTLLLIIAVMCGYIAGIDNRRSQKVTTVLPFEESTDFVCNLPVKAPDVSVTEPVVTTTVPHVTAGTTAPVVTTAPAPMTEEKTMPESTEEIIDKYTQLVNDFKEKKPSYKKKEYQSLPEEYRKFPSSINILLNIASNYMVSEEECEELVRPAGFADIVWDIPIHNTEKGCVLTDYDAVSRAECEDMGDGTYKLSFSLKEEVNAEPTPADTLIAPSAHGAVIQPVGVKDLMTEINGIIKNLPGIKLNDFSLCYHDCEFICIYNPETDELLSVTHHIIIDIVADIDVLSADVQGSARLINDMFIYDITW